jgi:hypothetical protein
METEMLLFEALEWYDLLLKEIPILLKYEL